MNQEERIGRRDLLKYSATGLAAASVALHGPAGNNPARAQESEAQPDKAKGDQKVVVGVIGTGSLGLGHHIHNQLLPNSRVELAAVCDVDRNRRNQAARSIMGRTARRVGVYEDYRRLIDQKDLDAVLIATPDHWHALTAIAAMEAGLDVYCEKPLTLTVDEGRKMVAAARRYGTVFQTGSQQRSNPTFRRACELVRNGAIGKLQKIDTVLHPVGGGHWESPRTPPDELNWNLWLGPAPYAEYIPNCVHYQFRWLYDYSGGVMTDWGAHHNDIAQWANGTSLSGPVSVDGTKVTWPDSGPYNVPSHFDVHYTYANGVELICHTDGRNGVTFTGEKGTLFVARGNVLEASDPEILTREPGPDAVRLYESNDHHNNWLDCIETRERCICDVEIGHRSVSICHIGNISMRLGRPLKWDPDKELFIDDDEANRWLSKPMRAPWYL